MSERRRSGRQKIKIWMPSELRKLERERCDPHTQRFAHSQCASGLTNAQGSSVWQTGSTHDEDHQFRYSKIDCPDEQIRLLKFKEDAENPAIQCFLFKWDLSNAPAYHAISYTWGDETPLVPIYVNGRRMMVRKNCWTALDQVRRYQKRKRHRKRYVWIDSICINQDDLYEKSFQVQIMGDIYAGAESVLISLGFHAGNSAFVVKSANSLVKQLERILGRSVGAVEWQPNVPWDERTNTVNLSHPTYTAAVDPWIVAFGRARLKRLVQEVVNLGHRPYWARVWIHQEVSLAQIAVILCGSFEIDSERVRSLANALMNVAYSDGTREMLDFHVEDVLNGMPMARVQNLAKVKTILPDDYLFDAPRLQCSDVRDRIYGVTRLVRSDDELGPIIPDYTKTREEVMFQAIEHWAPFIYGYSSIQYLITGLHLHADDMVYQKRTKGCRFLPGPLFPSTCECKEPQPIGPQILCRISHFYQVYSDEEGLLMVDIAQSKLEYQQERFTFSLGGNVGRRPLFTDTFQRRSSGFFDLLFAVCPGICAGDWIGNLAGSADNSGRAFFILRPRGHGQYEIIGHAVLCDPVEIADIPTTLPFQLCRIKFQPADSVINDVTPNLELRIHLEPRDLIAWAAAESLKDSFYKLELPCTRERFSSFVWTHAYRTPQASEISERELSEHESKLPRPKICIYCGGQLR